jgi:GxxExxY protein
MAIGRPDLATNEVSGAIVDEAYQIHAGLGPGLFESVYEILLNDGLVRRGLCVRRQVPIPIVFRERTFERGFRADLIVDDRVLVELKSMEVVAPVQTKKVLTYLRLSGLRVGLLINFGAPVIKDGIKRIINGYEDLDADGRREEGASLP